MPCGNGLSLLAAGLLLGAVACGDLSAQVSKAAPGLAAAPGPVCPLLSIEEVQKVTGREDYKEPWEVGPGEGIGGGSACVYEGDPSALEEPPPIGFVLISGKDWTRDRRKVKLPAGCKQEEVQGVGDEAFFRSCPDDPKRRSDVLYVRAGPNDLVVQMDVKPPATKASVRPTVVAFAKALVAKLR